MRHKKHEHKESVSICRDFSEGTCGFGDDKCWFNHSGQIQGKDIEFKCRTCYKTFQNRSDFMRHRKHDHFELLPKCRNNCNEGCHFGPSLCWFRHTENAKKNVTEHIDMPNFENHEVIQKMLSMMETFSSRLVEIEKQPST